MKFFIYSVCLFLGLIAAFSFEVIPLHPDIPRDVLTFRLIAYSIIGVSLFLIIRAGLQKQATKQNDLLSE